MLTCRLATIIVGCCLLMVVEARHVKLTAARQPPAPAGAGAGTGARSRVLVIRAPEGSGQPNRIIVLSTPPRTENTPPPKDPPKTTNTSGTVARLNNAVRSLAAATADFDRNFGGHPQSAIREAAAAAAATATRSTSQPQGDATNSNGTRSLRGLIEGIRNQRAHQPSQPNIARHSDSVPRAAPPIQPTDKRFGELNIPRVIEAALRRLQERARVPSNVRDRPSTTGHGQAADPWEGPLPAQERSPFHGGMIDLSGVRAPDHGHDLSHTHPDNRDTPGRERLATSALVPLETWDATGQAMDTQRPAIGNNDLLRMNADFQFTGGQEQKGKTGSNLRTFADGAHAHGHGHGHDHGHMSATPSTPLPADIQSLFDRFNIGSLDALSARLNSLTTQAPAAPSVAADASAVASSSSSSSSSLSSNSAVASDISPANNPAIDVNAHAHDAHKPVAVLDQSATVAKSSANTNSSTNTTSTTSVKTTSIKLTTVVKGGSAADVAAAAASQAEIAQAVAQGKAEGKELNRSSIADIAAKVNSKIGGAASPGNDASLIAPESNLPVGSISIKRQKNGESIITLNDGQGQPVVLRATGPVQIERIVKPDGKIQFLINPVQPKPQSTQSSTMNPADMEIEPEELFTTTMGTVIISDPASSTIASTQSSGAGFQDASALTSVASDLGLFDKLPTVSDALVTNLLQTPSGPTVVQTTTPPPAAGPKAEGGSHVSKTATGSGDQVSQTAASSGVVETGKSSSIPNIASLNQQAMNEGHLTPANNQNHASINDLFSGLFPDLGSGLFSLFESPRIPPPPRIAGAFIGNRGIVNPFVSDTNLFNVNKDIGLPRPSQIPTLVNQAPSSTMAPLTAGNVPHSTGGQNQPPFVPAGAAELNPNPPYSLVDFVPSVTRR